jgi:hypothetical protein
LPTPDNEDLRWLLKLKKRLGSDGWWQSSKVFLTVLIYVNASIAMRDFRMGERWDGLTPQKKCLMKMMSTRWGPFGLECSVLKGWGSPLESRTGRSATLSKSLWEGNLEDTLISPVKSPVGPSGMLAVPAIFH